MAFIAGRHLGMGTWIITSERVTVSLRIYKIDKREGRPSGRTYTIIKCAYLLFFRVDPPLVKVDDDDKHK